jgi:hypothetical protein
VTKEELKLELERLTTEELVGLGYIQRSKFDEMSLTLISTSSSLLDAVSNWAEAVVKSAQESKNPSIMVFAREHLKSLSGVISSKVARLRADEKT